MKKIIASIIFVCVSIISLFTLFGCHSKDNPNLGGSNAGQTGNGGNTIDSPAVTIGTETYRGFLVDNVYHSKNNGDIHFHIYVPESYDGNKPYALYVSLCGYGGYYFQGIGINLRQENFVFEAQKYNSEMIIVAPQLNDWGNSSANQTVALTEFLLSEYKIDETKVYANGYSGGGETLSLVMAKKPELFSAILHVSSIWDGELEPLVNSKVPVYFVIGESDEYYGSARISATYETLCRLYKAQGLNDEQIKVLAVLDVKPRSYFIERGTSNQHGGGGLFAFDERIMGWLFNR
ncbi:MAG: prolyl oligopeptidase family serine peptidase [Clostridia bacterium]|nr:prolyl oligopeptidase family serine peptidase [Clostridia bacterium]